LLSWVIQVLNQSAIVMIKVCLRVVVLQIIVGLSKTVLCHNLLVEVEEGRIFMEPKETRDAVLILIGLL
jgi:hypothetical protein